MDINEMDELGKETDKSDIIPAPMTVADENTPRNASKFNNKITTPFAETGLKLPFPETPQGDGLVNQQEGFTLKYRTPINAGGTYIKMENFNQIINETQLALKETQDKCVTKVNGIGVDDLGNVELKDMLADIDGIKTKVLNGLYIKKDNSVNIDTFTTQGSTVAFFHALDNDTQGTFPEDITVSGFYNIFNMGFANNADDTDLGCNGQLLIMGTYAGMPTNSFVYYRPRMISSQGTLEWGKWRRLILSGDVIPISDGGTGAKTAAEARKALDILQVGHAPLVPQHDSWVTLGPFAPGVWFYLPQGGVWAYIFIKWDVNGPFHYIWGGVGPGGSEVGRSIPQTVGGVAWRIA